MARYDSPGFAGAFPTGDPIDAGSLSNAHGSTGGMRPASDDLGAQHVSAGYDPNMSADVPQGSLSTSNDANPMRDGISGQDQSPDWMSGRPVGPAHPNAGR
jgi:hypothetical protein